MEACQGAKRRGDLVEEEGTKHVVAAVAWGLSSTASRNSGRIELRHLMICGPTPVIDIASRAFERIAEPAKKMAADSHILSIPVVYISMLHAQACTGSFSGRAQIDARQRGVAVRIQV